MGAPRDASPTLRFAHPALDLSISRGSCSLPTPHALRMVALDTSTGITGTRTVFISCESQLEDFIQRDLVLLESNWRLATSWLHRYDGAVTHSLQRT